jgi:hypothetical protein
MGCCGGTAAVHEVHAPQRECDYLPHHAVQWCPHAFLGAHRAWCSAMGSTQSNRTQTERIGGTIYSGTADCGAVQPN